MESKRASLQESLGKYQSYITKLEESLAKFEKAAESAKDKVSCRAGSGIGAVPVTARRFLFSLNSAVCKIC